jgi:hypothetical protein
MPIDPNSQPENLRFCIILCYGQVLERTASILCAIIYLRTPNLMCFLTEATPIPTQSQLNLFNPIDHLNHPPISVGLEQAFVVDRESNS